MEESVQLHAAEAVAPAANSQCPRGRGLPRSRLAAVEKKKH
jgi:hypothetical protein